MTLLTGAVITGCAMIPAIDDPDATAEYQQANDPAERVNRAVFGFNRSVDIAFVKPIAMNYHALPQPLRDSVYNFLNNWNEPLIFIHDILQGELSRAEESLMRFVLNTTLGIAGIYDIAYGYAGLHHHDEDMGQTLAVLGVGDGPYIILPLFGPSNIRDALGGVIDFFINPVSLIVSLPIVAKAGKIGLGGITQRERHLDVLSDLERTSLDYYASLRTLYWQRRIEEISNGHERPDLHTWKPSTEY